MGAKRPPGNQAAGKLSMAAGRSAFGELQAYACSLGFAAVGITSSEPLTVDLANHRAWLEQGYGEGMPYLSRDPARRYDPASLLSGCRSVVVLAHSIYTGADSSATGIKSHISRYARGDDYHDVIGGKLAQVGAWLDARVPGHRFRTTVDMSPIAEKALAVRAGIGWRGKHSLVLNAQLGSFFMLGLVLTTAEITPTPSATDQCGGCTACIDACPVDALVAPGVLNATRCLSFHTTALNGDPAAVDDLAGRLFGCDICQDACPYNASPLSTTEPRFQPRHVLDTLIPEDIANMDDADLAHHLAGTAMSDYGLDRLRRNARVLLEQETEIHG